MTNVGIESKVRVLQENGQPTRGAAVSAFLLARAVAAKAAAADKDEQGLPT